MTKNEIQVLRANLLGGMDTYIRQVTVAEQILMYWFEEGVPDDADEDTLMEIAEDVDEFERICGVFSHALNLQLLYN